MKIVIFGSGGVGGYFGGRLVQNGADVTFIARGAHLQSILEKGLRVDSIDGGFIIHPAKATDDTTSLGMVDLIFLATKAWQLENAIEQMKPLVGENTIILPMLNGMEHMDKLLEAFGTQHVLGGLCRISAVIAAPGHIDHVGVKPYIAYGEWDNTRTERLEKVHALFNSIDGIIAEIPANIHVAMWEKFIFISGTSGVGSYSRVPMGEYRSNPETRSMLVAAMEETAAIARARGVPIPADFVQATIHRIDTLPPQMMASMQKDVMAGRPSELNEQTGAVIRMGKAAGVPTPTQEELFAALIPFEQKARGH